MGGNFMIAVKNVSKTFNTPTGKVEVLKNINLTVENGDIFGIIGFSGAGKSTLIRCLNGLEKPDSGNILIGENEITKLNRKELRNSRKK
jgi:D-methionine transport system ATP-binding protein